MPRNRTTLTDAQIEELFEDEGATMEDIVFTGDTVANFIEARETWNERGTLSTGELNGYEWTLIERGQPRKGMQRGQTVIWDLGDVRAVHSDHTIT